MLGPIARGVAALRKIRSVKDVPKKLSSMDRAAKAYKRKEFLADAPRTSKGMPIPQLSSPDKLKGNLMRNLKKFSDAPQKIQTRPQLPQQGAFSRRPVE
jgi:hypothetical protein